MQRLMRCLGLLGGAQGPPGPSEISHGSSPAAPARPRLSSLGWGAASLFLRGPDMVVLENPSDRKKLASCPSPRMLGAPFPLLYVSVVSRCSHISPRSSMPCSGSGQQSPCLWSNHTSVHPQLLAQSSTFRALEL